MIDDSDHIEDFDIYEAIIPSPWIPWFHKIYQTGKVLSELDFAYQFLPNNFKTVAVTGTDGKSTTAWILYTILQKEYNCKMSVFLSGNFEIPFSETITEILTNNIKKGIIVIECSSFMGYYIGKSHFWFPSFSPDYTIFTNLKTDHLNWHRDLQEYFDAKWNLVSHTKEKAIVSQEVFDFAQTHTIRVPETSNLRIFSNTKELTPKDYTDWENIVISGRKKFLLSETNFSGFHNALNILSVTMVTNEMKICSKRVRGYLQEVYPLSHRLEIYKKYNWRIFVDDSKSTSAQSLWAALTSFWDTKNILLIAWWSDKGDDFSELVPLFKKRVKAVACIGQTKELFIQIAQKTSIPSISTDNLLEAVDSLYTHSQDGDYILLSPGCASFWLFTDYLDRANTFRTCVDLYIENNKK